MIIQTHDHLQKPLTYKATRLLVSFDDGTPLALIVQPFGDKHARIVKANDPDFNLQLKMYNIDKTVLVNPLNLSKLATG